MRTLKISIKQMQDETEHLTNADLGLYFRLLLKSCELELNPTLDDISDGIFTEESLWFDFRKKVMSRASYLSEGYTSTVVTTMTHNYDGSADTRYRFKGVPRKQRKNFALNSILHDRGYYVKPDNLPKVGG